MTACERDPAHPNRWVKGESGNPAGRPRGRKNNATLIAEALLEGDAEGLARKAIEKALAGDMQALRLCFTRLVPAARRTVVFDLPPIERSADVPAAYRAVLAAAADGILAPDEAERFVALIEAQRAAVVRDEAERERRAEEEASLPEVAARRDRHRMEDEAAFAAAQGGDGAPAEADEADDAPPAWDAIECRTDARGETVPVRFSSGARPVEVAEILESWDTAGRRYCKLRGADGAFYLVGHDGAGARGSVMRYRHLAAA